MDDINYSVILMNKSMIYLESDSCPESSLDSKVENLAFALTEGSGKVKGEVYVYREGQRELYKKFS